MLHLLSRHVGIKAKKRRLGRGNAVGGGNYSGRGSKGQKSRSGFSLLPQFEGGQTPIIMQMKKKRGFKRYYKLLSRKPFVISLKTLQQSSCIYDGDVITLGLLHERGLVDVRYTSVKIVGSSSSIAFTKKITFHGEGILFTRGTQTFIA